MPPPVFVPMNAFEPDGGLFGPELSLVQNALPVHAGWNSLQKKAVVASVADGPMTGAYVHIYQQTIQLQKARPEADTAPGDWVASPASPADLFGKVNETNPSDAQFIYVPNAPSSEAVKLGLPDLTDPASAAGHILRWRYRIPVTPSGAWTVTAQLYEGATLRATDTATGAAATVFVQREYTLTAGEANSITTPGYADLYVVFTATVPGAVQKGRPDEDLDAGGWTTQAGSSTSVFAVVDEASGDDADYMQSPVLALGGTAYTYKGGFTALVDPLSRADIIVSYRVRMTNVGPAIKLRLMQGATVVREERIEIDGPDAVTWAGFNFTLDPTEAALVTDPNALTWEAEAYHPEAFASAATQGVGPDSTIDNSGAWSPSGAATLQEAVDEASPSDLDFIVSPAADAEAACELGLAPAVDPLVHSGHALKVRCFGPAGLSLRVELLEGGGVIKSDTFTLGAYATQTMTLTTGEASLIGDYTNLSVRLTRLVSGFAGAAEVSWVRFETPEPARALISWVELEIPSASRAEISWTEFEVPAVVQAYKGDIPTIFCNSKTKIYEVTNVGFTDRSKGGGYGTGDMPGAGRFCSFGNDVIWTNRADPVQYRAANAGAFADLITSTRVPKARFAAPVRDHLVLADINLTGYFPDHVWWSAFDDARNFVDQGDAGANPATQSDQQRIISCEGQITGLVGGDYGVIFKRNSMHLMGWQGGQLVFRFDDISRAVGTPFPNSIVSTPYGVMWFDGATFQLYNGGTGESSISDIGNGILSQYMADNLAQIEPANIAEEDEIMMGHWDPYARVVIWTYRDNGGTAYKHTRGIVFNPRENRWGTVYDASLFAAVMASRKNVITSDAHLLKGTIGFDWSGTATSWFRFNGPTTYEMAFGSKRQALGIEGVEPERSPVAARLMGVLPVFSTFPAGSAPPALSVVVTASNDPWFGTDARQKTTDTSRASAQGILPCDITATWFLFSVTIPELTGQQARAFRGLYCFWAPAGQPGVTG